MYLFVVFKTKRTVFQNIYIYYLKPLNHSPEKILLDNWIIKYFNSYKKPFFANTPFKIILLENKNTSFKITSISFENVKK